MKDLPLFTSVFFALTTILAVFFFYKASRNPGRTVIIIGAWLALQALIGLSGFYTVSYTLPPRFILMVGPPMLIIIILFATARGRRFIDDLDIKWLTILHVVRLPVELVLFWLFVHKAVPELMTFEGRNWDIISGATAPLVFYFGFVKGKLGRKVILLWNIICLGLLINIVFYGILSVPSPFQQFAFDQPNIALLHFPFVWLPSVVVPLVLFSHLVSIRRLAQRATAPGRIEL